MDYQGERRSNATHRSTTDPEARLARKGNSVAAKLSYAGHLLMENRCALIAHMDLSLATGYAERDTALRLLRRLPERGRRRTVGGDKGYDTRDFVAGCREIGVTPHVAQNTTNRRSAIDGRTTRHRPRHQPAHPQAHRGTLRLDEDRGRWTEAAVHRSTAQPGVVPDDRSGLQPHPDRRPGRSGSMIRRAKDLPAGRRRSRASPRPGSPARRATPYPIRRSLGAEDQRPVSAQVAIQLGRQAFFLSGQTRQTLGSIAASAYWTTLLSSASFTLPKIVKSRTVSGSAAAIAPPTCGTRVMARSVMAILPPTSEQER